MSASLILRAALASAAATLALAAPAGAASTWTVSAVTKTATWSENTNSALIKATLSISPGATASPADDRLVSTLPITGGGCVSQMSVSLCPLGNGTVAYDTIVASLSGDLSPYEINVDLDRPGLRTQGIFSLAVGPNAPNGKLNGSATTVGPIVTNGFFNVTGGADDDALAGSDGGNDTLSGGPGDDAISGLKGNDTLSGGPGDDAISPGLGVTEVADGGEGSQDTLSGAGEAGPAALSLDGAVNDRVVAGQTLTMTGFENLTGGDGNDALIGDVGFNHLYGGEGNDTIDGGGGGHDVLRGQSGDDVIQARDALTLFGDIACGGGTDSAIVDAADLVASDCEAVDRSPAPAGFVPPTFPGGPTSETGAPAGNTVPVPGTPAAAAAAAAAAQAAAPVLAITTPKSVKRSALTKGVKVQVGSDQVATITVELLTTARAVRAAAVPKDNLAIARSTKSAVQAQRTFTLRPDRSLTRGLKGLSVRVTAVSATGVTTVVKRSLKLR
ncbi:MAG: hypothetical protein JHD16_05700 [Solirubrobacteraceae bacterium]|nr:hypothetical protein [Solirubrobacteraceae bacterium]